MDCRRVTCWSHQYDKTPEDGLALKQLYRFLFQNVILLIILFLINVVFYTQLVQCREYIVSIVVVDGFVLRRQGISSNNAKYAPMRFQIFGVKHYGPTSSIRKYLCYYVCASYVKKILKGISPVWDLPLWRVVVKCLLHREDFFFIENISICRPENRYHWWWDFAMLHYNDVIMSTMASRITSLTIVYSIVYSSTFNIKALRHWPLCGEFTDDRWIPRTNCQ